MKASKIFKKDKILLLDGAFGTQLQKRGLAGGAIPELLNVNDPELVYSISKEYIDSGSDIVYTNTFGANRKKLGSSEEVRRLIKAGVELARKAAGDRLVALDIGPTGALIEPLGSMTFDEAYEIFKEQVLAGKDGADLVVVETMSDLYELKAALLAVKENSDLPIMASMTFDESGRTFTGCSVEAFAITASSFADALGINCSLGPDQLYPIMQKLVDNTDLPVFIKANAGLPDSEMNYSVSPEEFAKSYEKFIDLGVSVLGGCCGTTPEYIEKLDTLRKTKKVGKRNRVYKTAVCSSTKVVYIDGVKVVGERINPTGKKAMKQALIDRDFNYIATQTLEQVEAGADILDVNAGLPQIDETEMLTQMVKYIQSLTDAPLQIDCSKPEAIERALRYYNGKPIVNSVNAEEKSLSTILPLVAKYGASVVGLTIDEDGIPKTVEGRVKLAEKIIERAKSYGIREEDVYIDCLTLTVSAEPEQAMNTLKAISTLKSKYKIKTALGVSNISFGLPARQIVNGAFLTAAMYAGLDLPILNPNIPENMQAVDAFKVLSCADKNCMNYTAKYADYLGSQLIKKESDKQENVGGEKDIFYCIEKGLDQARELTKSLLSQFPPLQVIDDYLIPALNKVGDNYEKGKIFLPQLIASADCAKACFEEVKKSLPTGAQADKGKIALATVKGDVHDIGKNIVKTVLENYGFKVLDLGKNVPPMNVVEAVKDFNIKLCGLSALMTTTLEGMKETIELLRLHCPDCKIMVGGAVLTEEYAMQIGADKYCKDANQSAKYAMSVFNAD
ncbi:MAG: homocysteine S-methyltransferase family protein [Clostridia bacterium]|nr:homocysteine S-methyltransferase family protein [Clostridia bacterium]MDE7328525.1 homocysteine S-methyltransferase family protein [Clostridia bacterium]